MEVPSRACCCLAFVACVGCGSDLGKGPTGHSIRGSVVYEGTRAKDFKRPASLVLANTELSTDEDASIPHALVSSEHPDLDQPIPYELRLLLPGRYFVVALVTDIAHFDATGSPTGSYPNACTLVQMPAERSVQMQDEDLEHIDIRVFDSLTDDPCFSQTPEADAGTAGGSDGVLEAHISASSLSAEPGDQVSVALFDGIPGVDEPAYTEAVTEPDFPLTIRVEGVAAGNYTVVVCFQKADSPSATCMGPDDRFAFYPSLSGTVAVDAAQTTTIDVDLPP
jgi:hypothetical protein